MVKHSFRQPRPSTIWANLKGSLYVGEKKRSSYDLNKSICASWGGPMWRVGKDITASSGRY
jgi:hypothetical protein